MCRTAMRMRLSVSSRSVRRSALVLLVSSWNPFRYSSLFTIRCTLCVIFGFWWICASRTCRNNFHTASFDRSNHFRVTLLCRARLVRLSRLKISGHAFANQLASTAHCLLPMRSKPVIHAHSAESAEQSAESAQRTAHRAHRAHSAQRTERTERTERTALSAQRRERRERTALSTALSTAQS